MSNYKELSPGLSRRQAYSKELENRQLVPVTRNQIIREYVSRLPQRTFYTNIEPVTVPTRIWEFQENHFTYENLVNLNDVPTGLISKNILENTIVKNNKNQVFCVVCQETIKYYDIIRELQCTHSFHINCIDTWFIEKNKCPTCKAEI